MPLRVISFIALLSIILGISCSKAIQTPEKTGVGLDTTTPSTVQPTKIPLSNRSGKYESSHATRVNQSSQPVSSTDRTTPVKAKSTPYIKSTIVATVLKENHRTPSPKSSQTNSGTVSGISASCQLMTSEGMNPTPNPSSWPQHTVNTWIQVNGLTALFYETSNRNSESSFWNKTSRPEDEMCGYAYSLKIPEHYNSPDYKYPLVVFLHGGGESYPGDWNWITDQFYIPVDDQYIIAVPAKVEWDWHPKKILDVVNDVITKLQVDEDRIYLTGLSMGGRGTYIVSAELPDLFAALMPLSSHHQPYSYVKLAPKIAHLPIWTSHGKKDRVSSYHMAAKMVDELSKLGAYVTFKTIEDGGHGNWGKIYRNPNTIAWLLSQEKSTTHNYRLSVTNGKGSGYYEQGNEIGIEAINHSGSIDSGIWVTSSGGKFEDKEAAITQFTMPNTDVSVTYIDK